MNVEITGDSPSRIRTFYLALRELGLKQLGWYLVYSAGLKSGYFRWRENRSMSLKIDVPYSLNRKLFPTPVLVDLRSILKPSGEKAVLAEAEEILKGRFRQFGARPIDLDLQPPLPLRHWSTSRENEDSNGKDIKFIWEPARFGWATVLARAYALSSDERYAAAFWERLQEFIEANPAYLGANWASGQEAAIRLITLSFCWQVFNTSALSSTDRVSRFSQLVVEHAHRISLTLAYARAQNNNHLLSEAAGLYTAGMLLPDHPLSNYWRKIGWDLFHQGIRSQISVEGVYIQHSANYTRLMLQLALWVRALTVFQGDFFPESSNQRLAAAVRWILNLLDFRTGQVPNLGPNDGAYFLPLTVLPFQDYRPVLQSAATAFLDRIVFEAGPWDEMALWLCSASSQKKMLSLPSYGDNAFHHQQSSETPIVIRSPAGDSWAYLRAAQFWARPGHADQLHVDLWWRGVNLSLDPGTFLYNAPQPWENTLAGSDVHNTLTIVGMDQMQRVSRFLFLDWAQARVTSMQFDENNRLAEAAAEHDGYRRFGLIHRRTLRFIAPNAWIIEDNLIPEKTTAPQKNLQTCSISWLLPDWSWIASEGDLQFEVQLDSPNGKILLRLSAVNGFPSETQKAAVQIVRGGCLVFGAGEVKPYWGWYSPTYGEKMPALAVRCGLHASLPITFHSEWKLG